MKLLALTLLLALLPTVATAGYTIVRIPKVEPQYVVVSGPKGLVTRLNPGQWPKPRGNGPIYQDVSGLYGDDQAKRVQLWDDPSGTATDAEIFAACEGLRDWKAAQIRAEGNARLLKIAQPYQAAERETWAVQLGEAEKWLADQTAPTPMVDAIAAGRGIDKQLLISYIIANTNLFRAVSGAILGQQQALLTQVYEAPTVAALLAVAWPGVE